MSEIVYAVHTRACTYLLDEDGFCRWVLSRSGAKSDDRCVGAQFVAALDLRSKGGLVGELRIGAQALFIRSEEGRFALIRTKPIEHVEVRGAEGEAFVGEEGYPGEADAEPEPEPVVLPDHLAVAAIFNAPVPAPEPPPPSARVILQAHPQPYTHRTEPPPPIASPRTEPLPAMAMAPSPPPPPPLVRSFPQPPPRENLQAAAHAFAEAHARPVEHRAHEPHQPYGHDVRQSLPRATTSNPARAFPEAPPRQSPPRDVRQSPPRAFPEPTREGAPPSWAARMEARLARDPSQETQPLPPAGRMPAWPPMLAPPPPQAEMMPLGPARPSLPSSEELDVDDLEEVGDDDQVYSMEVTLTLPLFRADNNLAQMGAYLPKRPPK
jgi:hypothetical protein